MAAPLVDCRKELLDGFLFWPETAVKKGYIGDGSRALLDH